MIIYFYFYLISFSLIGYGLFINKFLKINLMDIGNLGILGITFLSLISYSSSLFLNHGVTFNSIILIIGILLFFIFFKKIKNIKKEIILFFVVFTFLLIFISLGKNHDDFSYYHFPYSLFISEFSHPIGLGLLNNGFRSPSSIFFINSMFYLPKVSFYLFHLAAAYLFGFANLVLIKFAFDNEVFKTQKIINFLSLISLIFINIFFYRLAEHGTDRSGMILTILSIIYLLLLINSNNKIYKENNIKFIKLLSVYIFFVITIKPFFLINLIFILILFFYENLRIIFLKLFFTSTFYYCFILLFFTIFYTFINSGCFIFPVTFTCLENLTWSIDIKNIEEVNIWFELWSKAGASPNFVIDDRYHYITNFNWLSNWIENYFFNKVSDFILGITLLIIIIYLSFYAKKDINTSQNIKFISIYFCLILLFLEWFFFHPALRYGGYHLIALLFFIPICFILSKKKFIV